MRVQNRLTGWQVRQDGTRTATHRMAYGANGNLTYLDGTGTLEYAHPQKPYAVTGVYAAGAATPATGFEHAIEYSSFYRPASITSDTLVTEFTYNAGGERVKMESLSASGSITARYYLGGVYEADTRTDTEYLYLGGDAYSAPAVYVRQGNTWQVYYIIRDYLGSICAITNSGGLVAEYSYDPWGNLRDPETLETYAPGEGPELLLGRGFTGHEHLTAYGLINMNARLYDPMTGRFLSPDPYVQAPDFSQAFNRFSYCWNNPLKYADENGEFIVFDSWLVGFFKGLFQKGGGWKTAWKTANRMAKNDIKIWGGLFNADKNRNFGGKMVEIISRFTWQLPQTIVGFLFSQTSNIACQVDNVEYKHGATVLSGNFWGSGGAVTLGSYINGSRSLSADSNNSLFQHEYGHYLQSLKMGPAYLSRVGIPSLRGAMKYDDGYHDFQPYEQDANRRAFIYFNENVPGFYKSPEDFREYGNNGQGWNFYSNPLDVYHSAQRDYWGYYDYYNSNDMALINGLSLKAKWYDYLDPLGILFAGWINSHYYNRNRIIP